MRNRRNKRKIQKVNKKVTIITSLCIIIGLLFFSVIFSLINIGNNKIISGVKIEDIDISNLTQEEANKKIEEIVKKDILIYYEDLEETINMEDLNIKIDIMNSTAEALKIGRSSNIIKDNYNILFTMLFQKRLNIQIEYDEEKINKKIEEISNKLPGAKVKNSYYIENEELIIKKGNDGLIIENEKIKNSIKEAIKSDKNKTIKIPVKNEKIERIDIEKIHNEIYKEPQDAYITKNPTKVYAHINGVDFGITIEEANKIIEEEKEEYIIPLKITIPEKTLDKLGEEAFPNKLSEFTTRYNASNENRSTNLELASEKVNGTIILPGEIFSYNKIVGERTIAKGYKEATIYSGGKVIPGVGGGICQLSSTLYNAVLYSNLEITSRSNHRFTTSYVKEGRDATVSWGTIDFCFKNTRNYPIKIVSIVNNGIVRIGIYGIEEENEYEVQLQTTILETIPFKINYINDNTLEEGTEEIKQYGADGIRSQTYKILKQNGILVSKSLLSTDTYSSLEQIVKRGTKKVQEVEKNTQ